MMRHLLKGVLLSTLFLATPLVGAQRALSDDVGALPSCTDVCDNGAAWLTLRGAIRPATTTPKAVTFYGDSRAWYLAEGARLDGTWAVFNEGRQGCVFLGQDRFFERYNAADQPSERSVSTQSTGETLTCDARTYVSPTQGTPRDIAVILAGTLLTVDVGLQPNAVFSPLDPQWQLYLEDNLVESLTAISRTHRRVVVLDTPVSLAGWSLETTDLGTAAWPRQDREAAAASEGWLWADPERIAVVNEILLKASRRTGAIFLAGFADWVDAQPSTCQPDGSHFSLECGAQAALWVKNHLYTTDYKFGNRLGTA